MAYTEQKQRNPREGEEIPIPTCEICIEPISANKRFKCKKDCSYSFCLDCITKHIEVKVEENTAEVRCPGSNCPTLLNPVSFLRLLPARVFDKWCDVLCQRKVLSWPRAYCPFPQCSVLVLNECGGTISRCQCPNCNKLFCFQCQVPWHAGYRCSEAPNNRDRNDVLFGLLFENNKWARCPGCNHAVELVAGCRVVNCRCGTRFCYACGTKLTFHWCSCHLHVPERFGYRYFLRLLILAVLSVMVGYFGHHLSH